MKRTLTDSDCERPDRFHIHIVNANHLVGFGMAVGQAHLLDDIIFLVREIFLCSNNSSDGEQKLELSPDNGPSIIERMTFTYGLGEQHGLYPLLTETE